MLFDTINFSYEKTGLDQSVSFFGLFPLHEVHDQKNTKMNMISILRIIYHHPSVSQTLSLYPSQVELQAAIPPT
jgi:hypothetical protein